MRRATLAAIPGRPVLSALLRLLLAEPRREEFIGDLVEEAGHRLTDEALASWLWAQTLRSVPALVVLRVRHALADRSATERAFGGALAGPRLTHRGWSLSVAVSVAAHLTALALLLVWALSRVDELEPARIPVSFPTFLPKAPRVEPLSPPERPEPRPVRASHRLTRVPGPPPALRIEPAPVVPGPEPAAAIAVGSPARAVVADPPEGVAAEVPPHVAEKRCLFCPEPHLPAPYQRLGLEQELLVKTCVDAHGQVSDVETLRGPGGAADAGVRATVRAWRFAPHTVDGHPVPFCYTTRFVFAMR